MCIRDRYIPVLARTGKLRTVVFVSSGASLSQVEHKVRDEVVSIDANWIGCVLPVMGYPVTGTISLITALGWIG